jgi:hypothetical protein
MHSTKKYSIISCISFFTAILFCALYNQWVIITIPSHNKIDYLQNSAISTKKITLHYVHHEKWHKEQQELLWSDNITKNTQQLINAWLTLLDEERVVPKKITLQAALLSTSQTLYISFDHNPLAKEDAIFKKWMFIEGLLKTVRKNNIAIQHVHFLVQHQPLIDYHLDFSMPWPVKGFA